MPTITVRDIDLPLTDQHIIALRGDTLKSDTFFHFGPDGVTPINLTGSTITCKGALSDGTAVDLSSYLVLSLAAGSYYLSVPPTVTNGLTPWPVGLGTYDITHVDTLGGVKTYFSGNLGLREGAHV